MALTEDVKEVINQMIAIEQILRITSPSHKMSELELKKAIEAVEKSDSHLKLIKAKLVEKQ